MSEFQTRVAEWISQQGILFQLRHANTIGGADLGKKLGSFIFSLGVLAIFAAIVCGVGMIYYFKSDQYQKKIEDDIVSALSLPHEEDEAGLGSTGFERRKGRLVFNRLNLKGGEESFFFDASNQTFSGPVSFLGGVTESWSPGQIKIKRADYRLKAGGGEEMDQAFTVIEESLAGKGPGRIEISSLTAEWGYSLLNYGQIEGSTMNARRSGKAWEVSLKGGTFRQNWLQDFEVIEGDLQVSKEGIAIKSLRLALEKGHLSLSGSIAGTARQPVFDLSGEFTSLPVQQLLRLPGVRVTDYLSGTVSGTIEISGSTDRVIETSGSLRLADGDELLLREKWPVLRALSILDRNRSYRRMTFTRGGLDFTTGNGGLTLSKVDLGAAEKGELIMRLVGDLETRLPNQGEAAAAAGIILTKGFGTGFETNATDLASAQSLEEERFGLKDAVGSSDENIFGLNVEDKEESNKLTEEARREMESRRLKMEMNIHRLEGELLLEVPVTALADYEALKGKYPLTSNQRFYRLPLLKGQSTFLTTSSALADSLYEASRRSGGGASKPEMSSGEL